ncbi:hypothetical protein [Limoniibacter endophyticus]|uniref:hypothetical protein n=1 Tax=Limoniibacter endophyticus TaxID=1565040 RepID=UPI001672B244|nr:hypothetical protein [Limoniibacter endophyticus]
MDEFLLSGCFDYQVNLTQAISIGPKKRKRVLHQDDPLFPFLHPGQEAMINACGWSMISSKIMELPSFCRAVTLAKRAGDEYHAGNLAPNLVTKGTMKKGSVLSI